MSETITTLSFKNNNMRIIFIRDPTTTIRNIIGILILEIFKIIIMIYEIPLIMIGIM